MDRLFKKRTLSVREARNAPHRQNSSDAGPLPSPVSPPLSAAPSGKSLSFRRRRKGRDNARQNSVGHGEGEGERKGTASGVSDRAPSLNMDFRSSLILPG
jgi:hypothetical protein